MKKPCKDCPFRRTNGWYGLHGTSQNAEAKITAFKEADRQQIFSCHKNHPLNNVFSVRDMIVDDCAGFRMLKENIVDPGKHPHIVNDFNETGPESYDLKYWANKTGYNPQSNLLLTD